MGRTPLPIPLLKVSEKDKPSSELFVQVFACIETAGFGLSTSTLHISTLRLMTPFDPESQKVSLEEFYVMILAVLLPHVRGRCATLTIVIIIIMIIIIIIITMIIIIIIILWNS